MTAPVLLPHTGKHQAPAGRLTLHFRRLLGAPQRRPAARQVTAGPTAAEMGWSPAETAAVTPRLTDAERAALYQNTAPVIEPDGKPLYVIREDGVICVDDLNKLTVVIPHGGDLPRRRHGDQAAATTQIPRIDL